LNLVHNEGGTICALSAAHYDDEYEFRNVAETDGQECEEDNNIDDKFIDFMEDD